MVRGNKETSNEMKEYGGKDSDTERERNDGREGEDNGGISGERYEEWYYGHGRGEKEEEYKKMGNNRYWHKKISRYRVRMVQQMAKYGTEVQEFMKGEKAGKSWEDIFASEDGMNVNREWKEERQEARKKDVGDRKEEVTAIEIYHKLERLPYGGMIGLHNIANLEENEKDKVLLSLIVSKGARKFSKSKKELRRKWMWYRRETTVEIFNIEVAMSEAIFKATYLENEVKVGNKNKVTPGNIIPPIGTEWSKKVHQGENAKETLIEEI